MFPCRLAFALGGLAHWVADANNPFHISKDDPRLDASHDDYERYFERRLAKFPTVFYGLEPQFRVSSMLDRTFARSARFWPQRPAICSQRERSTTSRFRPAGVRR